MNPVISSFDPRTLPKGLCLNNRGYLYGKFCQNYKDTSKYFGVPTPENVERAKQWLAENRPADFNPNLGMPKLTNRKFTSEKVTSAEPIASERFAHTPVKNKHQEVQQFCAEHFLKGSNMDLVMDLPGPNMQKSLRMFENFRGLMVAEKNPKIFQDIRAKIDLYKADKQVLVQHPGDFFDMIEIVPKGRHVSLINYDGMGTMSGDEATGIIRLSQSKALADKCVFRITCSMRGRSERVTKMVLSRAISAVRGWKIEEDRIFKYREHEPYGAPMLTTQYYLSR